MSRWKKFRLAVKDLRQRFIVRVWRRYFPNPVYKRWRSILSTIEERNELFLERRIEERAKRRLYWDLEDKFCKDIKESEFPMEVREKLWTAFRDVRRDCGVKLESEYAEAKDYTRYKRSEDL